MKLVRLGHGISATGQIRPDALADLRTQGFRSVIGNRPDGEEAGQPLWSEIAAAAAAQGMAARHIPVGGSLSVADQAAAFADAVEQLPKPILAFCRTGARSAKLFEACAAAMSDAKGAGHHRVVIAGGGSAGIATAASMLKRNPDLDIAVIEPCEQHFYQPGWTMVGAGVFDRQETCRPEQAVMPEGVSWIKAGVAAFDPEHKAVALDNGGRVTYDVLIVAMGNRLAWDAIEGLEETLGENGVTSNYRYDLAPYTWKLVQQLDRGRALFTQPPMPIKCAGAPQKAMYLSCSAWERRGVLAGMAVEFHNAGGALFGVSEYVPALMDYVDRYGIALCFQSNLVRVDGPARKAWFATERGEEERDFDMLHVCPPQQGHAVIAQSALADAQGYAEVDPHTLRHTRYPEVFALGDCCSTPNAKTMAAVRKQAPVAAVNALAVLAGRDPLVGYDGYGSCPLTVEHGKIVLAEFLYGGKLAPTFPAWLIDGTRPSRLAWMLKRQALPPVYWDGMLKGREWLAKPVPLA